METRTTYIASCSFGKDSIATILLAMLHNEPLDRIVFVEVMFDNARGISGENPEHIKWVKQFAVPRIKELTGIDTDIIHSDRDYIYAFTHTCTKSKHKDRIGKMRGFPMAGRCIINRDLKMNPIHKYYKDFDNVIQYVGIAANEPKRLARLKSNQISLLDKYGYGEYMAYKLCEQYNLLSPTYKTATRNGCWFCPNARLNVMCEFRNAHPELWNELDVLDKYQNRVSNSFKYTKTLAEVEHEMDFYDRQLKITF